MGSFSQIKWEGTTPGADAFIYLLWSTASPGTADGTHIDYVAQNANRFGGCPAHFFGNSGIRKVVLDLKNSQAGTLNEFYSNDRGVTWLQVSTDPVAIPAAGFDTSREFLVESYADWKLEWTNGGVAQIGWTPQIALTDQRAVP